jgi:hypothetical protein
VAFHECQYLCNMHGRSQNSDVKCTFKGGARVKKCGRCGAERFYRCALDAHLAPDCARAVAIGVRAVNGHSEGDQNLHIDFRWAEYINLRLIE